MATLRGSKQTELQSIAATLELALSSANDEKELRDNVKSVIRICHEWADKFKKKKS